MSISPGLYSVPWPAVVIKFLSVCLNHFPLETWKSFLIHCCSPFRGLLWFENAFPMFLCRFLFQRLLLGRPCVVFTFAIGRPILLGGFITHHWFRSVNKATVEFVDWPRCAKMLASWQGITDTAKLRQKFKLKDPPNHNTLRASVFARISTAGLGNSVTREESQEIAVKEMDHEISRGVARIFQRGGGSHWAES